MMANDEFIGRRVSVGVGLETTYGTAVAPTMTMRQMKLGLQRANTTVNNESAMGRVEKFNDSAVVEQWAEGPIEGKLYDLTGVMLLYNFFGTLVTTDNADANAVVKDHTLNISQGSVAKSLTVTRIEPSPFITRRHAMATLESLEITAEAGGWVMVNGTLQALPGVTSSDVAAYVSENSFTSKHVTVKIASATAGLGAAPALSIKKLRLTLSREVTKYFPLGSAEPSAINVGEYTVQGEVTLRYTSNALEDLWYANTQQAMSIAIVNTDVTIGTAAQPGFVFTMPKVRLNTFNKDDALPTVVEQTVGFKGELDISAGYMIRVVATNTQSAYA